jgi:hypothetical protein
MSMIPSRVLGGLPALLVGAVASNLGAEHRLDLDAATSADGRSVGRHDDQAQERAWCARTPAMSEGLGVDRAMLTT